MRVKLPQSIDFNQMLVFSVFFHLVVLNFALFLPKPSLAVKSVVPAFMVNVVEISSGKKSQIKKKPAEKNQANTKIKTSKTEQTVIKKSKTAEIKIKKSVAVQKVVKKNSKSKTKNIINALKDLDKQEVGLAPLPTKKMFAELDQLAKLEQPKKQVAKKKNKRPN